MSVRTLKPKIIESVARARFASDSEIPPTPEATTLIDASSFPISAKAATIASEVPATSDFKITFKTFLSDWPMDSKILPRLSSLCFNTFRSLSLLSLNAAISRASLSFLTTWKVSPASGTLLNPNISTAKEGSADFNLLPSEPIILFTFPTAEPQTTISPTFNVPF